MLAGLWACCSQLLLSVLKRFIPALLHLLLSPSSIHLKAIKFCLVLILLIVLTVKSPIDSHGHWVTSEMNRKMEKKVKLKVYSREKIIDEGRAITRMKSPDLCPVMTQEWQRLSKLIRAYVELRYVKDKRKTKPMWKWFIQRRKIITTSRKWMNY